MISLITPHYQRKRFFRPRRKVRIWPTVRRYQLVELFAFSSVIALVWLGAHVDNQRDPWATPEPAGVQSASVELTIEFPAAYRPSPRRPL